MGTPTVLYVQFTHGRKTVDGNNERRTSEIIEISGEYMSMISDMSGHIKFEDHHGNAYLVSPVGNTGVMLYDGVFYTNITTFSELPDGCQDKPVPFPDVAHKFEAAEEETKRWLQFVRDEREAADMLYRLLNFVHNDQGTCTKHAGLTASFGKALATISNWRASDMALQDQLS